MAIVSSDEKLIYLKLRDPSKVTRVFPDYKEVFVQGKRVIAVPHTVESIRVLRNLGIKVQGLSPIEHYYTPPKIKGKYDPMAHQLETAKFLSENPRAFCLNQPRTGKTASVIMAIEFFRQQNIVNSTLIVAPRSCLKDVWEAEIFGLYPATSVAVLHGTKQQRLALLKDNYDVFVINPDGIKVIQKELQAAVDSGRINLVVFDEVTDFANPRSDRWKTAARIIKQCPYAWGLTGTPGGPETVYGIAKLINPSRVPPAYTMWRDKVMYKINTFKYVPRADWLKHVDEALRPSICFKKDDIMDLPPLLYLDREAELSGEQYKLYEEMRKNAVAEDITAVNAAVATNKLMQIATGAVKVSDNETRFLDIGPRMEELLRIIAETEYKVLVFAPFTGALDLLYQELSKHYSCAIVDGRTAGTKRDTIFNDFRMKDDPHVLLAHPKTMSFGLELAVADTIVFWGVPLNGSFVYQQAVERINSKLQKSKTPAVIHLHSTPVEQRLFKAIQSGVDINAKVLDLFKEIVGVKA